VADGSSTGVESVQAIGATWACQKGATFWLLCGRGYVTRNRLEAPVRAESSARVPDRTNWPSYATPMGGVKWARARSLRCSMQCESPRVRHGQTISMNPTDDSQSCRVKPRGGTRGAGHRAPARRSHCRRAWSHAFAALAHCHRATDDSDSSCKTAGVREAGPASVVRP